MGKYRIEARLHSSLSKQSCTGCNGARLRPEAIAVTIGGKNLSEITAMIVSFVVACYFNLIHDKIGPPLENWEKLLLGIAITTFAWILVTFLTKPTDKKTLYKFCNLVHAGGPGWNVIKKLAKEDGVNIEKSGEKWDMPYGILCMVLGCVFVYASLFATGLWIYGESTKAIMLTILSAVSVVLLLKFWGKLNLE